jgi:hydroxyethylthiazole kinase-like uncharacterized protein yjeF
MKIFSGEQVKQIDRFTIENEPISSIDLMERAASQCTTWLMKSYTRNNFYKIFVGPGNNGGDGLAIARHLANNDYNVEVFLVQITDTLSADASENLEKLKKQNIVKINAISTEADFPVINNDDIIIDSIFGSGLSRPVEGIAKKIILYLNDCQSTKIAIDIPSGLFDENNPKVDFIAFQATHTLTFQFPYLSFLFPENYKYTGEWHVLPIGLHPEIINQIPTKYYLTEKNNLQIKERSKFSHKGNYGHALLIAGSYGMTGASVLSTKACLRSGVGLMTTHIPQKNYSIIQSSIPEAIVSIDESETVFSKLPNIDKYTAIAVGPGIGIDPQTKFALSQLLKHCKAPMVIDADAINILSNNPDTLNNLPTNSILTPHPKEFERLAGKSNTDYERLTLQSNFAQKHKCIVVLKGAYTCIALPTGECWFNPTGNPGMATPGSGDVLTGIILSLLAQGYTTVEASITGVYLHGLAGDIAVEKTSPEALIASDIIENIGNAFKNVKSIFNIQ